MRELCLNVCRFCAPNIMSLGVCLKNCTSSNLAHLLDTASKFALFSVSGLKDEKLIEKQTYMKTETCKLYSRVFWIFWPNVIKIDPYNFELYRFKVGAFFWDTVYNLRITKEFASLFVAETSSAEQSTQCWYKKQHSTELNKSIISAKYSPVNILFVPTCVTRLPSFIPGLCTTHDFTITMSTSNFRHISPVYSKTQTGTEFSGSCKS